MIKAFVLVVYLWSGHHVESGNYATLESCEAGFHALQYGIDKVERYRGHECVAVEVVK